MTNPNQNNFPPGWDEDRVQDVIQYYDSLTDEEAAAEYEAAWDDPNMVSMLIPRELVHAVNALLDKHDA